MQRLCPRCRHAVTVDGEGSLYFCGHCGAPQVRVPEDLLEAAAGGPDNDPAAAGAVVTSDPRSVNWRWAILCAAICGACAVLLELVSVLVPFAGVATTFWAIAAPVVVLGIYAARFANTRIDAGFGARLGLLCGMAVTLGITAVQTVSLLLRRFVFHSTGAFDSVVNTSFAQAKAAALAQSGAAAAPFIQPFDLPEFRAGILLAAVAAGSGLYLVFSAAGGAFAGLLRSRKPGA